MGSSDKGVDSFRAGRGTDILSTADRTDDARINCGRGADDLALVDPAERSRVVGCERIP